MPAAIGTEFCHFPVEECAQGLLLSVCLCCVNSRWSTWVVRVGAPFPGEHLLSYIIMPKDYLLDYFSRKYYDDVVIFL